MNSILAIGNIEDFGNSSSLIGRITHHPALKKDYKSNDGFDEMQRSLKILFGIPKHHIKNRVCDSGIEIVIAKIERNIKVLDDYMRRNGYSRTEEDVHTGNLVRLIYSILND